jgi:serralysin
MTKSRRRIKLPKGSIRFQTGDGSYALVTKPASFATASKQARRYGGVLAEISSSSENAGVFDAITGRLEPSRWTRSLAMDGGGSPYVWLGGSDANTEGNWRWINSGESIELDRSEWGRGAMGQEPDNSGGRQHYLGLGLSNWPSGAADGEGFGNAGSWNDIDGSNKLFYVIEFTA